MGHKAVTACDPLAVGPVLKAPITKLVRTLVEPHAQLVRTVAAVKDQKLAAAG